MEEGAARPLFPDRGVMNLFVGDSLGLPMPRFNVKYEDTVLSKLSDNDSTWIICRTGATVSSLLDNLTEISKFLPDKFFKTTVIQVGLSDCAPRPLAVQWRDKLSRLRPLSLRRAIIRFLHRYRPQIQRHIGYHQRTPYKRFRADFDWMLKVTSMLSEKVVVILMPGVRDSLDEHSPGIRYEMDRYNECIVELASRWDIDIIDFVDELKLDPERNLTDDGHFGLGGQVMISKELQEILGGVK